MNDDRCQMEKDVLQMNNDRCQMERDVLQMNKDGCHMNNAIFSSRRGRFREERHPRVVSKTAQFQDH